MYCPARLSQSCFALCTALPGFILALQVAGLYRAVVQPQPVVQVVFVLTRGCPSAYGSLAIFCPNEQNAAFCTLCDSVPWAMESQSLLFAFKAAGYRATLLQLAFSENTTRLEKKLLKIREKKDPSRVARRFPEIASRDPAEYITALPVQRFVLNARVVYNC